MNVRVHACNIICVINLPLTISSVPLNGVNNTFCTFLVNNAPTLNTEHKFKNVRCGGFVNQSQPPCFQTIFSSPGLLHKHTQLIPTQQQHLRGPDSHRAHPTLPPLQTTTPFRSPITSAPALACTSSHKCGTPASTKFYISRIVVHWCSNPTALLLQLITEARPCARAIAG